jgi:hypothetical protein
MENPSCRSVSLPSLYLTFLSFILLLFTFILNPIQSVHAASNANVCFCHTPGGSPSTQCTSSSGEQHGHLNHGDQPFGCECGDGVCDANVGEDCSTCPTDCGACPACGDGTADLGEECGEPSLSCPNNEVCVGCRCLPLCGDGTVQSGEQCDGGQCCNGNCTFSTGSCSDGNNCTVNDVCQNNQCISGTPKDCSDGRACSVDSCDTTTGQCLNDLNACACSVDADCNDNNPCTDDICNQDSGTCSNIPNDTNTCDDQNACTSADHCSSGLCVGSSVTCDDTNPCTDDTCDSISGCVFTPNDTNRCTDADLCNGTETCQSGECVPGTPKDCSDGLACSVDSCVPETGQCLNDLSACTCSTDADCDDGNPCTDDTCNGTCSNVPNDANTCDDQNACTTADHCSSGLCVGSVVDCNDNDSCTNDSCNPATGCSNVANGSCSQVPNTPNQPPAVSTPSTITDLEGSGCSLTSMTLQSGNYSMAHIFFFGLSLLVAVRFRRQNQ